MWDSLKRFAGDRLNDVKKAAGAVSNELEYAGKQLQNAYNEADKAVDGFLPGGAKQSPVGRSYQQNYQDPGYSVEEPKITPASKPNPQAPAINNDGTLTPEAQAIVDTYTPTARVRSQDHAPLTSAMVGRNVGGFANPATNEVVLTPQGNDIQTLAHEVGHLNTDRKGSSYGGALGRYLTEPTEDLRSVPVLGQLLAPIRMGGGLIRAYGDAAEEEYAERFARGITGEGQFTDADRSVYGSNEYGMGIKAVQDGLYQLAPGAAYLLDVPFEGVKPSSRRK